MKMLYNIKLLLLVIAFGATSCSLSEEAIDPTASFVKIYDDSRFEASYEPVDIAQASDGSYIVLARRKVETSDFLTAYVMVIDADGNFVAENDFQNELVHPMDDILEINGSFYMVAMSNTTLNTQMVELLPTGEVGPAIPMGGTTYPLHASTNGSQVILQSFNAEDKRTVISVLGLQGSVQRQQNFDIGPGAETEAPIIEHFTNPASRLPFKVGTYSNGQYYFNGFYNYTFSLVFTNLNNDTPSGVVQGQHNNGGITSVMPLSGDQFAVAAFNYGTNYLMPRTALSITGITSVVDITQNPFPELVYNAEVDIESATGNNAQVTLMASSTQNGQIVVHGFAAGSGNLIGTKYLGYGNRNSVAALTQTQDGGLAILGTTFVAGRFERIVLYKLSEKESRIVLNLETLNTSS